MCGRFVTQFTWADLGDQLEKVIGAFDDIGEGVADHPARFNIAPTQPIIVVWQQGAGHKASLMRWGLVPSWVKDPSKFALIINARMETILEKPSFKGGLQHHRCIIPASGYYEWRTGGDGKKQPFYMRSPTGDPLYFAGIYSNWMGPSGEEVDTTAIITVPANPDLKEIHDRMPALIPLEMTKDWLNVKEIKEKEAYAMLRSAPAGVVAAHPVSTRVSSNRNDGEDLITPIDLSVKTPEPPAKRSAQMDLF